MNKRKGMIFVATFLCLITACSNAQTEEISNDNRLEILATEKVVDTDLFEQILIREIHVDLTDDDISDNVYIYLMGNSEDDLSKAEDLVAYESRIIRVVVKDGVTEDICYDRNFSGDHIGEGQLMLVTDQNKWYLFESNCHEQMGYASYTGEVFAWRDGKK